MTQLSIDINVASTTMMTIAYMCLCVIYMELVWSIIYVSFIYSHVVLCVFNNPFAYTVGISRRNICSFMICDRWDIRGATIYSGDI